MSNIMPNERADQKVTPYCPDWCDGAQWHDPDRLAEPTIEHAAPISGDFLPEVRRMSGMVTRPASGTWEVTVTQTDHRPSGGNSRWAEDPVVELSYSNHRSGSNKEVATIPLLAGEALQLARALTRGADRLSAR